MSVKFQPGNSQGQKNPFFTSCGCFILTHFFDIPILNIPSIEHKEDLNTSAVQPISSIWSKYLNATLFQIKPQAQLNSQYLYFSLSYLHTFRNTCLVFCVYNQKLEQLQAPLYRIGCAYASFRLLIRITSVMDLWCISTDCSPGKMQLLTDGLKKSQ